MAAAKKDKEEKEKLELAQQTPEDLAKASAEHPKSVTVPIDDEVREALDALRTEVGKSFPGMRVTQTDLARIAILRSKG